MTDDDGQADRNGQYNLALVPHRYHGELISQRARDGYINATAMCRAANKLWGHYWESGPNKAFGSALASDIGIPISELIQSIRGGDARAQGTWVHPQVAIHLAQCLSPDFAVRVSQWVFEWMSGKVPTARPAELPFHIRRYIANQSQVPIAHFSILTELTLCLIVPMEALGYRLPESLWPDISSGKMFAKFLRDEHGIDTDKLPTYLHVFEDGRQPVRAKAYPDELLHHFRAHFRNVWLPERAAEYFSSRDPKALEYLPRLLPARRAA
jgi:hypothetical protein